MEINVDNTGIHTYSLTENSFDSDAVIGNHVNNRKSEQVIYWRKLFASALLPLIITGAPVHHLFTDQTEYINNTKEWLKSMFRCRLKKLSIIRIAINGTLFIYSSVLNITMFVTAIWLFKELIIDGIFPSNFLSEIMYFGQIILYIIPINLMWFIGYKFNALMLSFESNENDLIISDDVKQRHFIRIGLLYFLLAIIEILHSVLVIERHSYCNVNDRVISQHNNTNNTIGVSILCVETSVQTYIFALVVEVAYILFFMVYIVFCWALLSKFSTINVYIKNMIGNCVPTDKHFHEIKEFYKRAANQVYYVNRVLSSMVSSIMELYVTTMVFDIYNCVILIIRDLDKEVVINDEVYLVTDETKQIRVRLATIAVITIIAKLSILQIVISAIIQVNDESKAIVVHLNDFVTQFKGDLAAVDYHSFRALKSYIISRMQRQDKRSLLSIRLLEKLPFFKRRIYGYIPL